MSSLGSVPASEKEYLQIDIDQPSADAQNNVRAKDESFSLAEEAGHVKQDAGGYYIKYVSLFLLTTQTAVSMVMLHHIRTRSREEDLFDSMTAVIMIEALKLLASLVIALIQEGGPIAWLHLLYKSILCEPLDCFKVSIPSFVYVIQKYLIFVAVSNLDPATCQVTFQFRILTTVIFSMILLKKSFSRAQWLSLVILFVGVAIVQMQPENLSKKEKSVTDQNTAKGFVAIILACCTSGFAGVYFEKILKGTQQSLWLRNIQLGALGVVIGFISLGISGPAKVVEKGFFHGYDSVVWIFIVLQSYGGLLVAVVVKYADNILKSFANTAAIILSCIASMYLFDFKLSLQFISGSTMVIMAVFLYNQQDVKPFMSIFGLCRVPSDLLHRCVSVCLKFAVKERHVTIDNARLLVKVDEQVSDSRSGV